MLFKVCCFIFCTPLRGLQKLERILKFLHIGDPRKGADIITRLVVESKYQGVTGGYFNVGTGKSIIPAYQSH